MVIKKAVCFPATGTPMGASTIWARTVTSGLHRRVVRMLGTET